MSEVWAGCPKLGHASLFPSADVVNKAESLDGLATVFKKKLRQFI